MARPGHIPYLLLLPILCGMALPTWGRPKPKPASLAKVAVREMEPYRQFYLETHRDTLVNCDTVGTPRALHRTSRGPVLDDGGKEVPGGSVDAFALGDTLVAQWTFLKTAGDSVIAMATLASRSGDERYIAFCIEAADIASVYVLHAAENLGPQRGRGPPGRGRHGPGGGGFLAGVLPLLTLVAAVVLVLTVL